MSCVGVRGQVEPVDARPILLTPEGTIDVDALIYMCPQFRGWSSNTTGRDMDVREGSELNRHLDFLVKNHPLVAHQFQTDERLPVIKEFVEMVRECGTSTDHRDAVYFDLETVLSKRELWSDSSTWCR